MPALRALRSAFPEHTLTLACPRVLEPLVRLAGVADDLHDTTGLDPLAWSGPAPEVAVNLHGSGPQSHALLLALSPRRLVAFGCPALGVPGPRWDTEEHEVYRWCRLLSESLQLAPDPRDLALAVPETPPAVADAVVIHPGAAFPSRRWPVDRFAAVASWAADRGWPVVLTGTSEEMALADEVRAAANLDEAAVLAGRTSLPELAAVVAAARLVVCGDTGVAHLASAYRTPSVVLFGPTPPAGWGPPEDGPHTVLWHGDGSGDPFAEQPDPALLAISVTEVLEAARATVSRTSRTSRRPGVGPGTTRASV